MTTRHLMGAWSVVVGLTCATVCAAGEHAPARAPVALVAPEGDLEVGSDLEKAYALEGMGRFDEAIVQYLVALVPAAPEQASFEVPLGIARLSEDRVQLEEALMAAEVAPLWDAPGFSLARAVLLAKLGYYAEVPDALLDALDELRMAPDMVPEQFPLLLEALLTLSERSPEAGAAALVSAFELTSPHPNVWQRGLRRIDQAVAADAEGLLALRAVAVVVNDSVGSEETAQKLEELLRKAPPGAEPEARLVELALDTREAGRELKAELARLRADGAPLTLADAVPRPVPEAENAAALYQTVFRARVAAPEGDPPRPPEAGPTVEELDGAIGREGGAPMPTATRDLLESPPAQQVLETLRQASLMPHSVFPLNWDEGFAMLLPHLASFRAATRVLAAYSELLAQEGRIDEALDWCMVALRMSEHASSEPLLVSQLVGIAMRAITVSQMRELLPSAAVPPAVAQRCEEYLRTVDLDRGFRAALATERAAACDLYQTLRTDPAGAAELLPLLDGQTAWAARLYCSALGRPLHTLDQLAYLERMRRVEQTATRPYREAVGELELLDAETEEVGSHMAAEALIPVYGRILRKQGRASADIGLCRVVLALKAYKHDRNEYPATLEQLQKTLEYDLPQDPFAGRGFVYRRQGEGFTLYSLGDDLDDDDGAGPEDEGHTHDDCDIVWQCVE